MHPVHHSERHQAGRAAGIPSLRYRTGIRGFHRFGGTGMEHRRYDAGLDGYHEYADHLAAGRNRGKMPAGLPEAEGGRKGSAFRGCRYRAEAGYGFLEIGIPDSVLQTAY